MGELALDGTVRSGPSTLGAAVLSARLGLHCVVGAGAAPEVAAVPGSRVHGVSTLAEAVSLLRDGIDHQPVAEASPFETPVPAGDLAEVWGQPLARRAVEIAAAGRHHLLLHGPPGGGKTMLARRLPTVLPLLSEVEAVEVALIHAAAGRQRGLDRRPPFRSPHHSASRAALVGGGSGVAVPGEVSMAHRGILFLDEMAEFPRSNLDTLRQPLEDGEVTVARRGATSTFPARFQLIAASNPCPCGYLGDRKKPCECRPAAVSRYRQRISGPLLDRFDLVVKVDRVDADARVTPSDSTVAVQSRVAAAADLLALGPSSMSPAAMQLLDLAMSNGLLTARGVDRVGRVAKTVAALAGENRVSEDHVAEAMALRMDW